MTREGEDRFLKEIDQELRSISTKLKKTLSQAQTVLKEHSKDAEESEDVDEEEKRDDGVG